MRLLIILFLCGGSFTAAFGQDCYEPLLNKGIAEYNAGNYDLAKKKWQSALEYCPDLTGSQMQTLKDWIAKAQSTPSVQTRKSYEPETVDIKGGTFLMGQSDPDIGGTGKTKDEQPPHTVTISNFALGRYEITVAQFRAFMEDENYKTDAEKEGFSWEWKGGKWEKMNGVYWKHDTQGNLRPESDYNHPVIHVSWNDAVAYCTWLSKKTGRNYRLPTEAEWEYAAGNGNRHTKYSWGDGSPSGRNGGNVADEDSKKKYNWSSIFDNYYDGYADTAPVGQYNPNDFNLYDMTGNVLEWCSDWYDADYYKNSPSSNPQGAASGTNRVLRGGAWYDDYNYSRVAIRSTDNPTIRNYNVGFRVARY